MQTTSSNFPQPFSSIPSRGIVVKGESKLHLWGEEEGRGGSVWLMNDLRVTSAIQAHSTPSFPNYPAADTTSSSQLAMHFQDRT